MGEHKDIVEIRNNILDQVNYLDEIKNSLFQDLGREIKVRNHLQKKEFLSAKIEVEDILDWTLKTKLITIISEQELQHLNQ